MSRYTTVILTHSTIEDSYEREGYVDIYPIHEQMEPYFDRFYPRQYYPTMERLLPCREPGGNGMMTSVVLIGAFNHFVITEFLATIKAMTWKYPEEVQVMFQVEEEDRFTVIGMEDID